MAEHFTQGIREFVEAETPDQLNSAFDTWVSPRANVVVNGKRITPEEMRANWIKDNTFSKGRKMSMQHVLSRSTDPDDAEPDCEKGTIGFYYIIEYLGRMPGRDPEWTYMRLHRIGVITHDSAGKLTDLTMCAKSELASGS